MHSSFRAADYLSEKGPFVEQLPGYQVRRPQLDLCAAIEQTLDEGGILTAEAGTGIGKTFAYLIPALLSEEKVIVSTGTRHLQDQLFFSDLPRVRRALKVQADMALLKGRSNYLCRHRLQRAMGQGIQNPKLADMLGKVWAWAGHTVQGDIAELDAVPEDAPVWPLVTSTVDNCLGSDCDHYAECHLVKARKKAQDADLVVINHHLLLADMALKNEGFADLLPSAGAFVIDEAHQLHDVASRFFGESVSSRQLRALARDTVAEQVNDAPDMAGLRELADAVEMATQDFRLVLGEAGRRESWRAVAARPAIKTALERLHASVQALAEGLKPAAERGRGLEQCHERAALLAKRLQNFLADEAPVQGAAARDEAGETGVPATVLWLETYTRGFMLHITPVDVAGLFRQHTDDFARTWIFTSATLQVNRSFEHFTQNLGIDSSSPRYRHGVWDSPFDYARQSLLYLPADMPAPSHGDHTRRFVDEAIALLKASRGRAFLLFTSYRAMHEAHRLLENVLPYPLLKQGDLPRHQLLETFRQAGNAILLGTASFWEGVDVRGQALSCVLIDKLPFASPGDPVTQARIDALRERGEQPFMSYQVPQAVIALKQGVGRLIRDTHDRGVIMIGDPRLTQKAYGRIFLNSLPPMRQTREQREAIDFFRRDSDRLQ